MRDTFGSRNDWDSASPSILRQPTFSPRPTHSGEKDRASSPCVGQYGEQVPYVGQHGRMVMLIESRSFDQLAPEFFGDHYITTHDATLRAARSLRSWSVRGN